MARISTRWCASSSSANADVGGRDVIGCHFLAILIATVPFVQEQRLGEAVCRLQLETTDVSLSAHLRLTISVEGPAPVEVDAPPALTASPDWRVRPGRSTVVALPGGRERYEQSFQLEPFQTGDRVPLPLEPWHFRTRNEVRDWTLTWPPQEVRVHSSVAEPDLSFARPVTGVEPLPPLPLRKPVWPAAILALVALAAAAVCILVCVKQFRARAKPPGSPLQTALRELRALECEGASPEQLPRLADLLRHFLEEQFSLAATRQTSAEFCTALQQKSIAASLEPLAQILQLCDQVKFAGLRPDPETCLAQFRLARMWLTETLQPALTESVSEANLKK
jgi:Domain of unknown function (DUF4381)